MTRINLVPLDELEREFIQGEYKEIIRVFNLVKKAQSKNKTPNDIDAPTKYKLGSGHVKFFYDKLLFVVKRYEQLTEKMIELGYKPNPISREELLEGIDDHWLNDYIPSDEEISISKSRLNERRQELGMK